ncbi:MAG: AsmA-like C-terminal domain-containing protein, partial [Caldimicrobium sp.]
TAKDIRNLLDVSNLNLNSEVEDGEVYIPEISLDLKEIKGYVSLEKGLIKFQGETKVNGALHGRVNELSIALFEKEPKISLVGAVEGEGDVFKAIGLSLTKDLSFLRKWDLSGKLSMNLELEGKLASPQIKLSFQPEALKVHIPNLKHELLLESGKINYHGDKIAFDSLKLSYDKSSLSIVKGEYIPFQDWLNFQINTGLIYEEQIKEFLEKYPKIYEIYSKYNLSLKEIVLDEAQYRGHIRVNEGEGVNSLFKALSLKGSLRECSGIIPYLGENFAFYSPKLKFSLNKGLISLLNSKIALEDSPFELEGDFNLENFKLYLNGRGTLKEDILNKIQSLFGINTSTFELKKPPIEMPTFKVFATNDTVQFNGDVFIGQLKSNIEFWKEKDFTLKGEIKGPESNFKLNLNKKEDNYFVFYNGKAKIDEISEIATTPFIKKGSVEGEIEAEINTQDLKKWSKYLEEGDLKGLINYYLKRGFFNTQGSLRLNNIDFNISPNLVISGFLNFDPQGIKGKEIALKLGKGDIFGDIELHKEKELLNVKGNLEVKNLDVNEYFKAKFLEIQREEAIKEKKFSLDLSELPLKGDLTLSIEKLTLPTLHTLQNLKGHILVKEGGIVSLVIPQINFCGLEFYAEYEKNPTFSYLFIDLPPTYGEFLDLFACAYPEEMPKTILEGPFKMEGFFYSDWEKNFLENSYGNFEIKSPKGYLYRAPLIIKVLGFLSPIDLFRGKVPNLENNLLPYEEIDFKGEFSNSYFTIDTLFLSAPGFRLFGSGPISLKDKKVTLTFLVSPFKTIDVIIEHIPYLNRFLLGKERMFIYLPLEVIGPYDNPTIVPLHPASIGKGIFRFIFKFFGIQEDFFKEKRNFEGFKKKELLERKSGNSVRR